jgi:hypothetical protein
MAAAPALQALGVAREQRREPDVQLRVEALEGGEGRVVGQPSTSMAAALDGFS